ncbi:MAG: diguanylate cyclase [Marivivens sp.]
MSGRVMIVDPVSTNRIVLKVKLLAARYEVVPCVDFAEALGRLDDEKPDLILVEASQLAAGFADFCNELRRGHRQLEIPVLGLGQFADSSARLAALAAGADDILPKPFCDALLLAMIRGLLRSRDEARAALMSDETRSALGFAESCAGFEPAGSVAIVCDDELSGQRFGQLLNGLRAGQAITMTPTEALELRGKAIPDLFVLDARATPARSTGEAVYQLIADLRSRTETRNAAQLVILPAGAATMAAMALDLGASATAFSDEAPEEMVLRSRTLLARKAKQDRMRDTLRSGLEAAVTDPLTGLYNRRYAMSHLAGLAERAVETGRNLAVMVLDIDHFKRINDTHGHAAGDQVLIGVGEILRRNLRAIDLVARIGGEEFLIAMPEASAEAARAAAERLRQKIATSDFGNTDAGALKVTMSVGIALGTADQVVGGRSGIEDLIQSADTALYRSKAAGRNIVTLDQTAA